MKQRGLSKELLEKLLEFFRDFPAKDISRGLRALSLILFRDDVSIRLDIEEFVDTIDLFFSALDIIEDNQKEDDKITLDEKQKAEVSAIFKTLFDKNLSKYLVELLREFSIRGTEYRTHEYRQRVLEDMWAFYDRL